MRRLPVKMSARSGIDRCGPRERRALPPGRCRADGDLGPHPCTGWPTLPRCSSLPQFLMTTNSLSTCCESGGRTLADSGTAASAQAPVYCPVYESRLLATARHELNSAAALGVYGGPYGGSQGYGNYVTYGSEASAFYSLVRVERCISNLSRHATPLPLDLICQLHFPQLQRTGHEAPGPRTVGDGRSFLHFSPPRLVPGNITRAHSTLGWDDQVDKPQDLMY